MLLSRVFPAGAKKTAAAPAGELPTALITFFYVIALVGLFVCRCKKKNAKGIKAKKKNKYKKNSCRKKPAPAGRQGDSIFLTYADVC
jgi:hypothetical protein